MTSSSAVSPSPLVFRSTLTASILRGGAKQTASALPADGNQLSASISTAVLGIGTTGNGTTGSGTGGSPLLQSGLSAEGFRGALSSALLGGSTTGNTIAELASLGATLNAMARTAQTALSATSTTQRAQALTGYKTLLSSLDASSATINGAGANSASLHLPTPGKWDDKDLAKGSVAIGTDMAAAVRAYSVIQQTIHSVGPTLISSMVLGV